MFMPRFSTEQRTKGNLQRVYFNNRNWGSCISSRSNTFT
eukprot:UN09651